MSSGKKILKVRYLCPNFEKWSERRYILKNNWYLLGLKFVGTTIFCRSKTYKIKSEIYFDITSTKKSLFFYVILITKLSGKNLSNFSNGFLKHKNCPTFPTLSHSFQPCNLNFDSTWCFWTNRWKYIDIAIRPTDNKISLIWLEIQKFANKAIGRLIKNYAGFDPVSKKFFVALFGVITVSYSLYSTASLPT